MQDDPDRAPWEGDVNNIVDWLLSRDPEPIIPLFEQVCDFANLVIAYYRARLGKRSQENVADFDYFLEWELLRLRDELRAGTYLPGPYRRFHLTDPKPRLISAAPFRDRVVHHALCNVIEPIFERRFIPDSYANRLGKGIHQALDRCTWLARRHPYFLKCDIVQFFPSIDLQILRHRVLGPIIQDGRVLHLIDRILHNGAQELIDQYDLVLFPGDDPTHAAVRPRGLPIGNQTSQFWANCYLNPLDHFITSQLGCRAYLRYVDDFLLFAEDKAQLHAWKDAIIAFLATQLRQTLHEAESFVAPVGVGIPFLGFRVYPDHRLLRRRNGVAFARRYRAMRTEREAGELGFREMHDRVLAWIAHVDHGDTWRLRSTIFQSVTQAEDK